MPSNIVQVAFLVSINVSLRRSGQLLSYRLPVDSGIGSHAALSSFFLVVFSVFLFLDVFLFFLAATRCRGRLENASFPVFRLI